MDGRIFHHPSLFLIKKKKIYQYYHRSAAPSAMKIGLVSGLLHPQNYKSRGSDFNRWMDTFSHHSSIGLPLENQLPTLTLQCGALRDRNWARQRPAASAKNTGARGSDFNRWMDEFFHHSSPSASFQKNQRQIYQYYHRSVALSAIETRLVSGLLHPQKTREPGEQISSDG